MNSKCLNRRSNLQLIENKRMKMLPFHRQKTIDFFFGQGTRLVVGWIFIDSLTDVVKQFFFNAEDYMVKGEASHGGRNKCHCRPI